MLGGIRNANTKIFGTDVARYCEKKLRQKEEGGKEGDGGKGGHRKGEKDSRRERGRERGREKERAANTCRAPVLMHRTIPYFPAARMCMSFSVDVWTSCGQQTDRRQTDGLTDRKVREEKGWERRRAQTRTKTKEFTKEFAELIGGHLRRQIPHKQNMPIHLPVSSPPFLFREMHLVTVTQGCESILVFIFSIRVTLLAIAVNISSLPFARIHCCCCTRGMCTKLEAVLAVALGIHLAFFEV